MASKILIFELSPCFPSTVSRLASLRRFIRPVVYYCGCGDFLRPTLNIRPSTLGRSFSTRSTTSSLNDPSPNWSNRPPKETILLDGCDFEHWLCVMEPPDANWTRDQIIDHYIKTLAQVVGSEHEARMKIYSVSTKHYFAFGANVSEEVSYKLKELPGMRWVLPDSYMDVKNKEYGGEPFINGEAVPYDPKYHEEWVRNNARANERSRRNDRPRNFDRSRNFERRRDSVQTQGPPPTSPMNQGYPAKPNPTNMPPPQNASQSPPPLTQGGNPSYQQGGAPAYQNVGNTYQTNVGGYQNYQGNPNPNPNPTNYQSNGGFQ